MSENKSLTVINAGPITPGEVNAEVLISKALDKGVSVDVMERLLTIRRELKAESAKEAFDRALASFQSQCPAIKKTNQVMNKDGRSVRYSYAPLEVIVRQVKDALKANGFSYTLDAQVEPGWVTATCKATHEQGHSSLSSFKVPIDKDAFMNEAQKFASALTFTKRYAFCNAFGILTGDEDDDSVVTGEKPAAPAPKAQPKAQPKQTKLEKFLSELKGYPPEQLLQFLIDLAWLMPNEPITDLGDRRLPKTVGDMKAFKNCLDNWIAKGDLVQPYDCPLPDPEKELEEATDASSEEWHGVIVPVPRKGQKREEYLKNPDTIGSLYDARHDDEDARKRLWGFVNHYEPKGWTGKDGKQRPPSDGDIKFREALDQFNDWFEKTHPEEKL